RKPLSVEALCSKKHCASRLHNGHTLHNGLSQGRLAGCDRPLVAPWPKPFINMGGSCETELMAKFPAHVVVSWPGHSVRIAQKHYTTLREEDFERAVSEGGAKSGALEAQNRTQQGFAALRTTTQELQQVEGDCGLVRDDARCCGIGKYTRQ